jgi:hypothetical protein
MVVKLALIGLSTFVVLAEPPAREPTAAAASQSTPLGGFWPTESMTRSVLARWVDESAVELDLSEDQQAQILENALNRWPKFLEENRAELQPLLNEWIEMRLAMEPPSTEQVQAWSERMLPVWQKIRGQFNDGIEDVREVLNPLQRAKFESEVLQFNTGLNVAEAKIKQWHRGEFKEHEFWDPPRSVRKKRREARKAEQRGEQIEAEAQPVDQVAEELKSWDRYTEEFIRIYELDEGQKSTARSCLKELRDRATAYRDRNIDRINKLEDRIARSDGSRDELKEIEKLLIEVYGPIDDMFKELQARLEGIPTSAQRAKVEEGKSEERSATGD